MFMQLQPKKTIGIYADLCFARQISRTYSRFFLEGVIHINRGCIQSWIRWNIATFARLFGSAFAFLLENPLWDRHLRTQQTSRRRWNYARACSCGETMYPTWLPQELHTMLEQKWETLYRSFFWASVGIGSDGDPYSTFTARSEELGAMVRNCRFHRLLARQPHGVEHHQQTHWQALCPIPANSIVSQLVKIGAHKTGNCESTRLIYKQLSDFWKVPTPEGKWPLHARGAFPPGLNL